MKEALFFSVGINFNAKRLKLIQLKTPETLFCVSSTLFEFVKKLSFSLNKLYYYCNDFILITRVMYNFN